ncbi:T9SS type A sorting domain-containing protein [Fluviicola sp.]|uniref:T9SS type A sorting domain-containing protein n=1 Tax=Fluviicola sp. TaxID=1917219 RepID=UPI0031DAD1B6
MLKITCRLLFLLCLLSPSMGFSQAAAIDPTFSIGTGFNGEIRSMVAQTDGKIICVGLFTSYNGTTANNIIRLNPNGSVDLTFNTGGSGANQGINDVILQSDGKILIGGHFSTYNGVSRVNIARLNTDGTLDASFNAGTGSLSSMSYVNAIRLQTDGKMVVGGSFDDFNGNMYVHNIMRLNSNGSIDLTFGSVNIPYGFNGVVTDLVVDFFGKITAVGQFTSYNVGSTQYPSVKIARINSNGTFDATFSTGTGITGDPYNVQITNGIYVSGVISNYNGTNISGIVKLNDNGSLATGFNPGTGNSGVLAVAFQPNGKIIVGGPFVIFNGATRYRIARLNADGSIDATFNPGPGFDNNYVMCLLRQADGKIIAGGNFTSYNSNPKNRIIRLQSCDTPLQRIQVVSACNSYTWINGTTYTSSTNAPTYLIPGVGSCDSLIKLNLTIHNATTGIDTRTACNAYTWINGITYTSSTNTPTFVLQNAAGCDSTVTLHLTIQSNTGIDVRTACNSYTWINGITYTSSTNTPTFVLQNASGCDSTVTLHLTINHSTTGTEVQTACDSYTWIDGNTYTSSTNTPTFVLQNASGCDSTVTLHLTINHSTTGTDVQTACDSYTWIDGNTYIASTNTPTFVLQNASGCDSIVTLHLTINHSTTGTEVQTACDSYTWIDGNTYTSSTNTPTFVLQNASGCDSTVTLHLTINHSTTGTDVQTACDSYTWIDGNTYTSSTNTPAFVLQNASGCDSTVTLDLTINHSTAGTDVQTACDSYTWIDGNTYIASTNTPTFVLQNASGCDSTVTLHLTINHSTTGTDVQTACDSYTWIDGNTYTSSTNTPTFVLQNASGCDSIVTLHLTINHSTAGTDVQTACDSYTWIDGNTYIASTNTPTFVLQNVAGCDSTVTLHLTIIPALSFAVENIFVLPSDANSCVGEAAIDLSGNAPFELDFDNGSQVITSNGYSLVTGLCAGVHDLHVTSNCGDTLSTTVVIPVDSNYVFNNPFIDSLALDSLGVTMTNCDIFYNSIDTAYIDSIWANGNTVNVIWNIVDSNGSNFDTASYVLNNGNGIYWLQLSVFCPNKSLGEFFTVTEAISFYNGHAGTAGLTDISDNLFEIYPNPATDLVHIHFSGPEAELTVYDSQGKVVLRDNIQNNGTVSLQNFERGVYLFDFKNSQGHNIQRIVKQ